MWKSKTLWLLAGCVWLGLLNVGQAEDKVSDEKAKLEKEFSDAMTGSTLVGNFSVDGKEAQPAKDEKYTIVSVKKVEGDQWLIVARIQYGDHDVTVPVPLEVKWAGDTPVMTLTDLTIPKMGTFTSRVMIYRGRYAGTWQHDKVGGNMWGRLVKQAAEEKPKE